MVHQATHQIAMRAIGLLVLCIGSGVGLFLLPSTRADDSAPGAMLVSRAPQSAKEIRVLEAGQVIKREIQWQETQVYEIRLAEGEYAQMFFAFPGSNNVDVFAPDGKPFILDEAGIVQLNPTLSNTREISILAEVPGSYRIQIVASYREHDFCEYQLEVRCKRLATEADRRRVEIFKAYAEIFQSYRKRKAESYLRCIEIGKRTAPQLRTLGEPFCQSNALYYIGVAYWELGRYAEALDYMKQALDVARDVGNPKLQAIILISIGQTYQKLSEYQQALAVSRPINQADGQASWCFRGTKRNSQ